jgi:hypothetical protein
MPKKTKEIMTPFMDKKTKVHISILKHKNDLWYSQDEYMEEFKKAKFWEENHRLVCIANQDLEFKYKRDIKQLRKELKEKFEEDIDNKYYNNSRNYKEALKIKNEFIDSVFDKVVNK